MTVRTGPERKTAELELFYETDITGSPVSDYSITVTGVCGDSRFIRSGRLWFSSGRMRFKIDNAELWWPKNYGAPNLYDIEITLKKNGKPLDCYKTRTGFRTVSLVRTGTTDMFHNGTFHFLINQRKVFIMGTNWVPVDSFHSRDRARIPKIMELLKDTGCNAVRCWGGNIYEDPLFYRYCDEMGILVWQDFAMACGVYPTDYEFKKIIYDETVEIIHSLRQHPSIVLWSGDNECDQFVHNDGYGRDPGLNRLTREVLPDAVYNEDPARPICQARRTLTAKPRNCPRSTLRKTTSGVPGIILKANFTRDHSVILPAKSATTVRCR